VALRNHRLAALALFVALAIFHTWPLAGAPGRLSRLDNDDAALNTWTIAWVAHASWRSPLSLFEAPIFYPEHDTLAYSEHLFVPAVMGAPLLLGGASPVLVHNLLFMLGLALSGWAMCLVMTAWTGSRSAGIVAGLVYAFNAHVLARFAHLQAQHVEFFPLAFFALDRVLVRGRARDGLLLAGAFTLQALCSNYLMVFTAFAMVAAVLVRPADWLPAGRGPTRLALAGAAVVSAVALAPFVLPYARVMSEQGLVRTADDVARYSAGWTDYLATGGRLHYALWSHRFFEGRTPLFPGVMALGLALVALTSGPGLRDGRIRMAAAFGAMGVALSFGPALPGYARLHAFVPLLAAARAAARWGWLLLAAVAVLAGFGVAQLQSRWELSPPARPAPPAPPARLKWPAGVALIAVLVTLEAARAPIGFSEFRGISRIYDLLAADRSVVLVEFPLYYGERFNRNGPYLLNNTRYLRPLVNGYSGFQPARYLARGARLQGFPAPAVLDELRAIGVTHVAVHVDGFARTFGADALDRIPSVPDLSLVADADGIRLYRFTRKSG
jgi:hypothetical protein